MFTRNRLLLVALVYFSRSQHLPGVLKSKAARQVQRHQGALPESGKGLMRLWSSFMVGRATQISGDHEMNDFPLVARHRGGPGRTRSKRQAASFLHDGISCALHRGEVLSDAKVKHACSSVTAWERPVIRQFYRAFPEKTAGLVIVDGALRILFPKEQMDQFMTPLRTNYQAAATRMVEGMVSSSQR